MPSTATYLQRPDPPAFIALVCGDQPPACGLTQALQRSLGRVVRSGKLVEVIDADGCDVVAVHYDALSPRERAEVKERLRDCSGPPTLFLFERCEAADLAELFDAHSLRNMLVVNHCGVDASDLVVTVQKLRTEDIFGLEKYFVWGVSPRRTTLRSSEEAPAVIDQVVAFAQARGIGARLRATIRTVANEFLSNALYNAPVAADGTHRYESRPRTRDRSQSQREIRAVILRADVGAPAPRAS